MKKREDSLIDVSEFADARVRLEIHANEGGSFRYLVEADGKLVDSEDEYTGKNSIESKVYIDGFEAAAKALAELPCLECRYKRDSATRTLYGWLTTDAAIATVWRNLGQLLVMTVGESYAQSRLANLIQTHLSVNIPDGVERFHLDAVQRGLSEVDYQDVARRLLEKE